MQTASDMYTDDYDIGAALDRDVNGAALRDMRDILHARQMELKRALDRGVTPAEFQSGQAMLASYEAARRGLDAAWEKRHKT